jgi:hypothetical protein
VGEQVADLWSFHPTLFVKPTDGLMTEIVEVQVYDSRLPSRRLPRPEGWVAINPVGEGRCDFEDLSGFPFGPDPEPKKT